jgi:hypothetical protein
MSLADYFENAKGYGFLATADGTGLVNVAVYARPHVVDEATVAFIMAERRTHENLQGNPGRLFLPGGRGGMVGQKALSQENPRRTG